MAGWQNKPFEINVKSGETIAFCMCGNSKNGPYCDDSHKGTGISPQVVTYDIDQLFMHVDVNNLKTDQCVMVLIKQLLSKLQTKIFIFYYLSINDTVFTITTWLLFRFCQTFLMLTSLTLNTNFL